MYPVGLTRMRHAELVQQCQSRSTPTADASRRAGVMDREDMIAVVKDHEDRQHSLSSMEEDNQRYPEPPSGWPQA